MSKKPKPPKHETKDVSSLRSSVRRLFGWALLLSPFIALAVIMVIISGWWLVAVVYGITALIVGVICIGVVLIIE